MSSSSPTFPPVPESAAANISSPPLEAPSEDSEEVIENYLADFLKRHNIGDSSSPEVVPADRTAVSKAGTTKADTTDRKVSSKSTTENAEQSGASVATPRIPSVAPESADDLSTLRKLANSNARTALESHFVRQMTASSRRNLVFAILASFFSIVLASLAAEIRSTAFITAVVALSVSWVATYRYLRGLRQISRRERDGVPVEARNGAIHAST